jgi:hypothetical protein
VGGGAFFHRWGVGPRKKFFCPDRENFFCADREKFNLKFSPSQIFYLRALKFENNGGRRFADGDLRTEMKGKMFNLS